MELIKNYSFILVSAAILLLGGVWIAVSAVDPLLYQTTAIAAPQADFLAPDFSLQSPDGETLTLSELRGRPVLLNLWASWCGPCRAEMPAMEAVYQEYRDQGFVVVAVNATNQDNLPAAVGFAEELGLSFPILVDQAGEVSALYQLRALPSSYFIGRDGKIREVVIGGPMAEALLRTRVEDLLEEIP